MQKQDQSLNTGRDVAYLHTGDFLGAPLIGKKVPDIEIEAFWNEKIKKIKLSDYKGKWVVLLFYPGDFTFVCPTELEESAGLYNEFKKNGAEVLSVSTDSVYVHKAWHDQSPAIKKVAFPMLADPTGKLCRIFGVYIEETGEALRGSFLIDPDGIIKAYEVHDTAIGRNAKEFLRRLQAAMYTRDNKGMVCPASWEPGKKTLKKGLDLVGKI